MGQLENRFSGLIETPALLRSTIALALLSICLSRTQTLLTRLKDMEHFWIQVFLLRAALALFYQSENPSNATGLLLVGGAKTGISQSVEFWTPVHARSGNSPLEESAAHLKETSLKESSLKETALKDSSANKKESSMHCPTTARGMWGHTTDYLPNGQGGEM